MLIPLRSDAPVYFRPLGTFGIILANVIEAFLARTATDDADSLLFLAELLVRHQGRPRRGLDVLPRISLTGLSPLDRRRHEDLVASARRQIDAGGLELLD